MDKPITEFVEKFLNMHLHDSLKPALPPTLTGKFEELVSQQLSKNIMEAWHSPENIEKLQGLLNNRAPTDAPTPFENFKQQVLNDCDWEIDEEITEQIKIMWDELSSDEQKNYS